MHVSLIFAFQFVKPISVDHIPNTIHSFRDSILVCKIQDSMIRKNFQHFHSFPSSDASNYNEYTRWKQPTSKCFEKYLALNYLFKLHSILSILLLKNNLTNICCEINKIEKNLWMVYIIHATWRALESTKEGKEIYVLCIVTRNRERSVVIIDHFSNFKGI